MTKENQADLNIDDYDYELIEIDRLKNYQFNSKIHSEENIKSLMASILDSGLLNPILIDENMVIVGGHGRTEACRRLGHRFIKARILRNMSEEGIKRARIQDNRTASTDYDAGMLRLELGEMNLNDINLQALNISKEELERLTIDYEVMDVDALSKNLDEDIDRQIKDGEKDIKISDKKKIPVISALGFKQVTSEAGRKIARFIAKIEEELDLPPEEAFVKFIEEVMETS